MVADWQSEKSSNQVTWSNTRRPRKRRGKGRKRNHETCQSEQLYNKWNLGIHVELLAY